MSSDFFVWDFGLSGWYCTVFHQKQFVFYSEMWERHDSKKNLFCLFLGLSTLSGKNNVFSLSVIHLYVSLIHQSDETRPISRRALVQCIRAGDPDSDRRGYTSGSFTRCTSPCIAPHLSILRIVMWTCWKQRVHFRRALVPENSFHFFRITGKCAVGVAKMSNSCWSCTSRLLFWSRTWVGKTCVLWWGVTLVSCPKLSEEPSVKTKCFNSRAVHLAKVYAGILSDKQRSISTSRLMLQ